MTEKLEHKKLKNSEILSGSQISTDQLYKSKQ